MNSKKALAVRHHEGHQAYNLVPYGQRRPLPAAPSPTAQQMAGAGQALEPTFEAFEAEPVSGLVTRCVAPPRLDGHTRARYEASPEALEQCTVLRQLRSLFADRERLRAERNARGMIVRELPTGHWAECNVTGTRRHMVTLYVWDRVHVTLNIETGDVKVQWKARELWQHERAGGARRAVLAWCAALSEWLDGVVDLQPTDLYSAGWSMTGIELCADFVGLAFDRGDVAAFLGRFDKGELCETHSNGVGELQTIQLGSRRSNVSLCVYDKTAQIRDAKDGRNLPTYAATWERNGWDGENVTRVELRLAKRGLEWRAGEDVVDLRDPLNATDPELLRKVWASLLGNRYRLVQLGTATRERRCKLDPRWQVVVDAAAVERAPGFEQARRESDDAYAEKLGRASREATKAILRVAALHGVTRFESRDQLQTATTIAVAAAVAQGVSLGGYADAYWKLVRETLGEQIDAAWERWQAYSD